MDIRNVRENMVIEETLTGMMLYIHYQLHSHGRPFQSEAWPHSPHYEMQHNEEESRHSNNY